MKENIKIALFTIFSILVFSISAIYLPNAMASYINPSLNYLNLFLLHFIIFIIFGSFLYFKTFKKYTQIVELNIRESTLLLQFYRVFSDFEYKLRVNAKALVDNYIIKILTFKGNNLEDFLYDEMEGFYTFLYKTRPKNNTELKYMDNGLSITREIENIKNQYIFLNNNKMNSLEKILFFATGILSVIFLNLILQTTFVMILIKTILSTIIIYFMWYLYSLDYIKINSNTIKYELYEKVLDQMGVLRYYPEQFESEYDMPKDIKEYRSGNLNIDTKEISITVVKNEDSDELDNGPESETN